MQKNLDISLKKQAKQQRSIATVDAIVEAATYILKRYGPNAFTAQKVVEKAGVNIASFYQYFPNKEALLFHITKLNWEKEYAKVSSVIRQPCHNHAEQLKDLIREFFLIEAAEADLRQALRIAAVDLKDTKEYKELMSKGRDLMKGFLKDAVKNRKPGDLDFDAEFIGTLVTSFAERVTDERTSNATLIRQADVLSEMLISYYKVS